MQTLIVSTRENQEHRLDAAAGSSIMEIIRDGGIDELLALCGGSCSCATCHVYVDDRDITRLPRMSADEDALLDSSDHRTSRSRLSCQLRFGAELDGLHVTIAPED